jgi:hypothetical protein
VFVVTAAPFTTWLVRLGPVVAPLLGARHDFDPCAVIWIAEDPGHDPVDPDLDPALDEGLTAVVSYTLCTFGPYPGVPEQLRSLRCERVSGARVEDELLRGGLDDGGVNPRTNSSLPVSMAELVRGPGGARPPGGPADPGRHGTGRSSGPGRYAVAGRPRPEGLHIACSPCCSASSSLPLHTMRSDRRPFGWTSVRSAAQ